MINERQRMISERQRMINARPVNAQRKAVNDQRRAADDQRKAADDQRKADNRVAQPDQQSSGRPEVRVEQHLQAPGPGCVSVEVIRAVCCGEVYICCVGCEFTEVLDLPAEPGGLACCYWNGCVGCEFTEVHDLPTGPGGSACCYWNRYGTQCSHPAQGGSVCPGGGQRGAIGMATGHSAATRSKEYDPRAGWVSMSLLEWLRDAVQPPGWSRTHTAWPVASSAVSKMSLRKRWRKRHSTDAVTRKTVLIGPASRPRQVRERK